MDKIDSREWSGTSVTVHYRLAGEGNGISNDATARALLVNSTAESYMGLYRDIESISMRPVSVDTVTDRAEYECSLKYVVLNARTPQPGQSMFTFDTSGVTQHVNTARATTPYAPQGQSAPDFKGAINVTDRVEGLDIDVGAFNFTVKYIKAPGDFTGAYLSSLYQLTDKVNNANFTVQIQPGVFYTFAPGEVRFRGARGGQNASGNWEIEGQFSAIPNQQNIAVGDITGINKNGWEYMWVRYLDNDDPVNHVLLKIPVAVYVQQLYLPGDFSPLQN